MYRVSLGAGDARDRDRAAVGPAVAAGLKPSADGPLTSDIGQGELRGRRHQQSWARLAGDRRWWSIGRHCRTLDCRCRHERIGRAVTCTPFDLQGAVLADRDRRVERRVERRVASQGIQVGATDRGREREVLATCVASPQGLSRPSGVPGCGATQATEGASRANGTVSERRSAITSAPTAPITTTTSTAASMPTRRRRAAM